MLGMPNSMIEDIRRDDEVRTVILTGGGLIFFARTQIS